MQNAFFLPVGVPPRLIQENPKKPQIPIFPTSPRGFPHEEEIGFTFFSPSEGSPTGKSKKTKKTQNLVFLVFFVEVPSQGWSFFRNLRRGEVTPQKNSHLFR
jgi:hypothetical protein